MFKKIMKFIRSCILYFVFGSLLYLVLALIVTKVLHIPYLSSSVALFLYLISIFLSIVITKTVLQKILRRTNVGNNVLIRRLYKLSIYTIGGLFLLVVAFLLIYVFIFRPFQVNGDSMLPNFQNKEYTLTNIISLSFGKPELGDVIVFKSPIDPEKDFIDRVIGVAGDTVMLKDGNVYINSKLLNESKYLKDAVKTYGGTFLKDGETITVPINNYFVLGDNRLYSTDSRDWGLVSYNLTIGKVWFCYFNCVQNSINNKTSVIAPNTSANIDDWKLFTSDLGNFRILLPTDHPNITSSERPIINSKDTVKSYYFHSLDLNNGDEYKMEFGIYPPTYRDRIANNISTMLKQLQEDSIQNLVGAGESELISSKSSSFKNFPSVDSEYKKNDLINKGDYFYVMGRLIIVRNYFYSFVLTTKNPKSGNFSKFVNSFELIDISPASTINTAPIINSPAGFLSGQDTPGDIKSLQDYIGTEQASKDSWKKGYATGRYSQQDLDKVIDLLSRIISFSQTILTNLQSGNINTSSNISLWKAVVSMSNEAGVLANKLNGQ